MITWVCKTCGRAIKSETKPNFCYFDRMDQIENIGDEDAARMGLFSTTLGVPVILSQKFTVEFIKDLRYDPMTGEDLTHLNYDNGQSLTEFQEEVMKRVYAK